MNGDRDDFEDRIRDETEIEVNNRLGNAPPILVTLPIKNFTLQQTPGEFLIENARPYLYELLGRTAREGLEQGGALWTPQPPEGVFDLDGQPLFTSTLNQGIESGVKQSVRTPQAPVDAVIQISIHTHPLGGSIGLSSKDWRSVAGDLLQFPPRARQTFETEATLRAFVVLGQRLAEEEERNASMRWVQATAEADRLTIEESRERSQELFGSLEDSGAFDAAENIIAPVDDLLDVGIDQFDIPEPADTVRFRDAIPIPEQVSDREFGNAFADGDLREVLRGVDFL